jgi:phosphoribosyl 1,2-cyclic phosphodiesterase
MPLYIASLNSGSNGNCYYIGNHRDAVLVDAGISCRDTALRLSRLGLNMNRVKAVFISHEHTDHTRGVEVLARRYGLPVYITEATYRNSRLNLEDDRVMPFRAYDAITVGGLSVTAFPKRHDATDPHSFIVSGEGATVGILTDIGSICEDVIRNFRQCHAAFLEANYDEEMLEKGRYPQFLKNRIRSDHGHLSNDQALQLFREHKPSFMTHLLLSHLSQDNNDPELVRGLFAMHAGETHVSIASRHGESEVYHITGSGEKGEPYPGPAEWVKPEQMKLF